MFVRGDKNDIAFYSTRITSFPIRQTYLNRSPGPSSAFLFHTYTVVVVIVGRRQCHSMCSAADTHTLTKSKSEKIETHNALFYFIDAEQMCAVLGVQESYSLCQCGVKLVK